jgi:hypothetical protein
MGESLTERRRVNEEALRGVKFFSWTTKLVAVLWLLKSQNKKGRKNIKKEERMAKIKKRNWKCFDCNKFTLTEAEEFWVDFRLDRNPKVPSKVSVCINCDRVYKENGGEFTIDGKKVYYKEGQFLLGKQRTKER